MKAVALPDESLEIQLYASDAVLLCYRGSIAHGMYMPGSDPKGIDDRDLMGIRIYPVEYYLGLGGVDAAKEYKHNDLDMVIYEIRKAFSLLLQGNPNVLS